MIKKQNSGWMRTIWQDLKTSCGKDCSISFPTEIWLRILSRRILKSKWCSDLPITPVARKENYLWIERYSKCSEKFTIRKARAIPNRKTGSLSTSMTSYRWTRQWARSIQQKNSGKFGLKLNGSAQSKRKSFEKSGPPFEVNHFFSVGPVRSKLTVPFDLFDSFSIPIPRCSLLSIGVTRTYMCSNNNYKAVLRSVCFGC